MKSLGTISISLLWYFGASKTRRRRNEASFRKIKKFYVVRASVSYIQLRIYMAIC